MTIRNLMLATAALGLALAGAAPAASALGETCTVTVSTFGLVAVCTGTLPESASLDWCPNEPWIDCYDPNVTTCTVGTSSKPVCRWTGVLAQLLP